MDRWPFVLGSNITLAYLSSVYRLATQGYRQQYVDALNELLERAPYAYAVVAQRVLTVAGGRLEVSPADCDPDSPDEKLAGEIAEATQRQLDCIPRMALVQAELAWGIFYGMACQEVMWARTSERGLSWRVESLEFVHSRRLAYPDPSEWEPHIWDLGTVQFFGQPGPTSNLRGFGVRVADYPGKFLVHVPGLRGDYPTRDGIGREIGFWLAIAGIAIRGASEYVERFAKPWTTATYNTAAEKDTPRIASNEDKAIAEEAARGLGAGALSYAVLPDSIKMTINGPGFQRSSGGGLRHLELAEFVNRQIAMVALGQSDTAEAGPNGSRAAVAVRKEGSRELFRFDAQALAHSWRKGVVEPFVHLNWPGQERLTPKVALHPNEKPDPKSIIEVANLAAEGNVPVDARKVGEELGLPLVDPDDPLAVRMRPIKPGASDEEPVSLTPAATPAQGPPEDEGQQDDNEAEPELGPELEEEES